MVSHVSEKASAVETGVAIATRRGRRTKRANFRYLGSHDRSAKFLNARLFCSRHTFVENDFVAEDLDVEFSVCKKTIQDVSTWLAPGLDV